MEWSLPISSVRDSLFGGQDGEGGLQQDISGGDIGKPSDEGEGGGILHEKESLQRIALHANSALLMLPVANPVGKFSPPYQQ
jgi:hypothetical protein